MKPTTYIWMNGKLVPWAEANVHILTHALHYGTGVFEGIRAYATEQGTAIFRGPEHFQRLADSARIYEMPSPYTPAELNAATKVLIKENKIQSCYIRPLIYYGFGAMGLFPGKNPIDTAIAVWEWGTYLGEDGLKKGIKCKISSWTRVDGRSMPPLAKCCANYANSVLAKNEAVRCGYDEAILLNSNGTIAEGPGENIFLIKEGKLYTPPTSDGPLAGITCLTAIKIAQDLGIEFSYKSLTRDELFLADELFFTGTAAEVTPIREIDGRIIGSGGRGPVTERIQSTFFEIVQGKNSRYAAWLDVVN